MAKFCVLLYLTLLILAIGCHSQEFHVDPCFSSPCATNAICSSKTNPNNYTCQCPDGFAGDGYSNCTDVCNPNPCSGQYETCHTHPSTSHPYVCTCDAPNYNSSDGSCCHQFCSNDGSGNQSPNKPFATSPTPTCQSHCTYPTYVCPSGNINYQNPPFCQAYSICKPFNPCGNGTCTPIGNNDVSYNCTCAAGYVLNENGFCEDEDECQTQLPCKDSSTGNLCTNTEGGYECSCNPEFTIAVYGNGSTSFCIALNLCANDNGGCDQNCENTPQGPFCTCVDGYTANGTSCLFDETSGSVKCSKSCSKSADIKSGTCLNGTCHCFNGYKLREGICVPEYSCADIKNNCNFNFNCTNTPTAPGYSCNCDGVNYQAGPDGRCYDVNECLTDANSCSDNATCTNIEGGYECECNVGYSGNGFNCSVLPNVCNDLSVQQSCAMAGKSCREKSSGEADCYCAIPYALVGDAIHDSVCVPPPGSSIYVYELYLELAGYFEEDCFDARRRLEKDLLATFFPFVTSVPVLNIEIIQYHLLRLSGVQLEMNLLFNEDMSYLGNLLLEICSQYSYMDNTCILPSNKLVYNASIALVDVTNSSLCTDSQFVCGSYSKCQVLDHNYACECVENFYPAGYANSRRPICVDRNECAEDPDICNSPTQVCHNHHGNYSCQCIPCYIWNSANTDCIFVCQQNPCQNNGFCQPVVIGDICSYGCTCGETFFGPNCEYVNQDVHVARNDEAIIGGVLGGLLIVVTGLALFLVYKMYKWKGYFSIQKRKEVIKGV